MDHAAEQIDARDAHITRLHRRIRQLQADNGRLRVAATHHMRCSHAHADRITEMVTEMVYAELLRRFPDIVNNRHPEFWIRYNLHGAVSHCPPFGDSDACDNDINEMGDAPADSGPDAIRAGIKQGLDERCVCLKYMGIEQFNEDEDEEFKFYVHWQPAS